MSQLLHGRYIDVYANAGKGFSCFHIKFAWVGLARLGDIALIHFVGWVDEKGQRGREIYNSRMKQEPVSFVIGTDKVMQAWNEGVIGMKVGGTRLLRIPPELGYGDKAVEDVVPANAYLQFIIELLAVE